MKTQVRVIIIIAACLILSWSCSSGPGYIDITPSVRYQGNILIITSGSSYETYESVKIELNDGTFKRTLPFSIPPGGQVKWELSDFTKSDGERFNILKYRPVNITISCEVVKLIDGVPKRLGKGFYYGRF